MQKPNSVRPKLTSEGSAICVHLVHHYTFVLDITSFATEIPPLSAYTAQRVTADLSTDIDADLSIAFQKRCQNQNVSDEERFLHLDNPKKKLFQ